MAVHRKGSHRTKPHVIVGHTYRGANGFTESIRKVTAEDGEHVSYESDGNKRNRCSYDTFEKWLKEDITEQLANQSQA